MGIYGYVLLAGLISGVIGALLFFVNKENKKWSIPLYILAVVLIYVAICGWLYSITYNM